MTEFDKHKAWIDTRSYEQLLHHWRTAPLGSPLFQGKIGDYYTEVMRQKRSEVGDAAHVTASKSIGWD